ncbi:hypothetical protein MOSE0_M09978 [Monosporozyma servazzii]
MSDISKFEKEEEETQPSADFLAFAQERKEGRKIFDDQLNNLALRRKIVVQKKLEHETETERVLKLLYPKYKSKIVQNE